MSLEAVRAFYVEVGTDPARAKRYQQLTHHWLTGHNPEKIIALAASTGHHFTLDELNEARLTNYLAAPVRLFANLRCLPVEKEKAVHFADYNPTVEPAPPEDPEALRRTLTVRVQGVTPD